MQLGNNRWESTQFNSRLQPTQIALGSTQNATNLLDLDYSYGTTANNGNVLSQTITVPTIGTNTGFTAVQTYTYDSLNRIKSATENLTPTGGSSTQTWKQTFTYDRYGNRNFDEANTTTLPKLCTESSNPAVCPADRKVLNPEILTSNNRLKADQDNDSTDDYLFDNSGNTTKDADNRTFIYDAENKQIEVKNSSNQTIGQYWYDGDGKRVKKYSYENNQWITTIFVYNASGQLVAEYSTQTSQTPQVSYLTNDHLGSPRINTDQNGLVTARHDYHPFGEEILTSERTAGLNYADDSIRQQFTGYQRDDEIDLDFAQARYYNKNLGRFNSVDPLLSSSEISNPQTWNRFKYALNNPLIFVDPLGLYEWASSAGGNDIDNDGLLARSKDKTLSKKVRELAKKQYDFRKKFEAGLKAAKVAANDPRLTPEQRAEAQRAVNSYGDYKKEDNVSVGIVDKKNGTPNVKFGETDGKIHVDLNLNLLDRNPIITIAHEGSHIADFQELVNARGTPDESSKDIDGYTTESRAYFVSSYIAQALDEKSYYPGETKDRQIWNKGWKENEREVNRANGVENYNGWSKKNRGRKLSEMEKNKRY